METPISKSEFVPASKTLIYLPLRKKDAKEQILDGVSLPFWKPSGDPVGVTLGTHERSFIMHGKHVIEYVPGTFAVGCKQM